MKASFTSCLKASAVVLLISLTAPVHGRLGNGGTVLSDVDDAARSETRTLSGTMYSTLACNSDASPLIDSADCLNNAATFSSLVASASASGSDVVVVPCGTCAVVDYTDGSTVTLPAGGLDVLGRLHFPATSNVVINTTSIVVQGLLDISTPNAGNQVKVTLYGTDEIFAYPYELCSDMMYNASCIERKSMGKKPIAIVGGKVDIQAIAPACPSWTTLKSVAGDVAGQTRHFHVDPSFAKCIRPGDDLLITSDTLSHKDDSVYVVESIDFPLFQAVITVEGYTTRIFATEAGHGEAVYAAEVAGLRRDVVFEAQHDDPNDMHGGHLIVFHTPNVVQTIRGVLFENFGQDGNIGRYPIHFHMCGDTESFVSQNVVRGSNQRCYVIHNTNQVTVDDNIAYDVKGHCFITETGDEEYNTFSNNLGARGGKLSVGFGQSDTPNHTPGKREASTFWIRNMKNTIIGNVAAGSSSMGFWFELKNLKSDQLSPTSFKDNKAHSNFHGLNTYKKGWKPNNPAVIDNFIAYKNDEGAKFHISGNFAVKNSLIADNVIGVRYGVWNSGVTLENTLIVANTDDAKLRLGRSCPITTSGILTSFNNWPSSEGGIRLKNVTFSDFTCGKKAINSYYDSRLSKDMGDPVTAVNVSFVSSDTNARPSFGCGLTNSNNVFMEDINGTLGPDGKGPGFIIRDNTQMKAFLSPDQCQTMSYGGGCSAFCENVCLRMVKISSGGASALVLSNGEMTYSFSTNYYGAFQLVLPNGNYHGNFFDSNDTEIAQHTVDVTTYRQPLCDDYVTTSSFTFPTVEPTSAPSSFPTVSSAPTITPFEVVKFKSTSNRYIFAESSGSKGLRLAEEPVSEITFELEPYDCASNPYKDLTGVQCYLLKVPGANNRRFYAQTDKSWTNGIGTVPAHYKVYQDNRWHFEDAPCEAGAAVGAECVYIRNSKNGRSLYDNGSKFGASPKGIHSYVTNAFYKWENIPA